MEKKGWDEKVFIIDGFPRNAANLEAWERIMGEDVELPVEDKFTNDLDPQK